MFDLADSICWMPCLWHPQGSKLESFNLLGEFVNCYYTGVNCNKKGISGPRVPVTCTDQCFTQVTLK